MHGPARNQWFVIGALNVLLQSFSSTSIYRIGLQSWAYSRMRRNGYLWTSGVNLDTAVRFADHDFLLKCKISAIWRRFPLILHFICWMSDIFLLPVCLTYWPRKYITRVDPHVDNSHRVWSWYDHPLPSYSVFVYWYLEQLSYMADHVSNLATKFEDPTPVRSWV